MRLCCADGEKCDIHNAFPIRGCHAWTHLATCRREMDRKGMRINGLLVGEREKEVAKYIKPMQEKTQRARRRLSESENMFLRENVSRFGEP